MTDLDTALWLVFDTETTGDTPGKDTPVEIGFALTDLTKTLVTGSCLVDPTPVPVSNVARSIHHIDPATLVGQPNLRAALKMIAPKINEAAAGQPVAAYVAHNAEFDAAMLPMLTKLPWLCTYQFSKRLYPTFVKHTNQFLRYELGVEVPELGDQPPHRAGADAIVTAAVLRRMLMAVKFDARWPNTVEELLVKISEPILLTDCTFGKHKGKTWEEIAQTDPGYIEWMLKPKPDKKPLDRDLKFTLEHWSLPIPTKPDWNPDSGF